jgi:FkbM family methyltransferase
MGVQPSQQDEERLVCEFFFGAPTGFFVEVGANHPTLRSQSWHLEQTGWTGVLIEPQPDLAAFLAFARTAKVFAVACSSPDNAGRSLPLHVAGPLSALDRSLMAPGARPGYTIMVPTRTLDEILEEAQAPVPIDLLSIDVEGHELEVLRGFDLKRWKPRLILLEDHVANLERHHFLTANDYRLVRRLGNNGWYVPQDAHVDVSMQDRWEILRKYYLGLPFRMARNASRRVWPVPLARRPWADRASRLAAVPSFAFLHSVWRTGRTCPRNCPTRSRSRPSHP